MHPETGMETTIGQNVDGYQSINNEPSTVNEVPSIAVEERFSHFKVKEFIFPCDHLVTEPCLGDEKHSNVVGIGGCSHAIADDTVSTHVYLFTENIVDFKFYLSRALFSNGWIVGGAFGKKQEVFITGPATTFSKDTKAEMTAKRFSLAKMKQPYFEEITVQTSFARYSDSDDPNLHYNWRGINYLKLVSNGIKVCELGKCEDAGGQLVDDGDTLYNEPCTVKGKFIFTGIGVDKFNICLFQLADYDSEAVSEMFRGSQIPGLVLSANEKAPKGLPKLEHFKFIAVEDSSVLETFQELVSLTTEWEVEDATSSMLPQFLTLLSDSIDNPNVLHSILRLSHLMAGGVENFNFFTSKDKPLQEEVAFSNMFAVWGSLTKTIVLVKTISDNKPKPNLFECAMLRDDIGFKLLACLVGLSQIALGVCLVVYSWDDLSSFWKFEPAIAMSFVSSFLVVLSVKNQLADCLTFRATFPEVCKKLVNWPLAIMDILVNIVFASAVVVLTFVLIGGADELLDIVLNSVAAVFIISLDDDVNPLDEDDVKDLIKDYLITDLISNLDKTSEGISAFDVDDSDDDS